MLGQSSGMGFPQSYQPHAFNEPTWSLAKYTTLTGQKVNVEGNVRAVFSMHRRQLAVWNDNVILICIDLHHSKTTIPTKDKYAIVKENNVSLCRLKFRSLADRVSFGTALADLVPVSNDKGASQEVSSQGWPSSSHVKTSSQSEFVSSQGRSESPGTVLECEIECLPRPSRVSTPLSTVQISPTDSSPWRCYFNKNVISPIPRTGENETTFKIPTFGRSRTEKKTVLFEEEEHENAEPGEGDMSSRLSISIGNTLEEPAIWNTLNESLELFDDDDSRSRSEIGETIPFNLENWTVKKEDDSIDLFNDDEEEDGNKENSREESEKKISEGGESDGEDVDRKDEGEWGMTHSFIARLREIPQQKKSKLQEGAVIRVKGDRALMHGQDCPCCREYYDALGLGEKEREARVNKVSRHRFVARPMPQTPPHYWEIDFPSEEEQIRRGLLRNH